MKKICAIRLCLIILSFFAVIQLNAQEFFWEEASPFTARAGKFPVSAFTKDFSAVAWQEVAPNRDANVTATGFISIYLAVKETDGEWEQRGAAAGPYPYSGTEPSIINLIIDHKDRIIIAASAGGTDTEILISENRGRSFSRTTVSMGAENSVAPRIFVRADGGYLLFVTRGSAQAMSIYYSRSSDGITWSAFEPFTPENTLSLNFLPTHASIGRRDFVFFQSLVIGVDTSSTFQLFYKISEDGGRSWTQARRFTTFNDPVMQVTSNPNNFDNQRPHLIKYGDNLFITWERRFSTQSPSIYCAVINANGNVIGSAERVNNTDAYCQNPIAFIFENKPAITWFDNRSGNNRIILAHRGDLGWQNSLLSSVSVDSSFARPVVTDDGAFIFWQTTQRNAGRIYILSPDHSAAAPRLTAVNFTPSRASRAERARVSWNIPSDTSGIMGFSWTWSQDEKKTPAEEVMIFNTGNVTNLNIENHADNDGYWYFSVRARDFSGNWSASARITYYKKTTPPAQVRINTPETDAQGFLTSNTFNILWQPSEDPFLAGYTWNLQYLGANENAAVTNPPPNILGSNTTVNYTNQDNGVWSFSVAAIDQAGNIGQPSNIIFRTNKFIPYTSISYVDAQQDEQGVLAVRIIGRGFATNGQITSVVLERENDASAASRVAAEGFTIQSDREISGIIFDNIEQGQYRLLIEHSVRGWYTAPPFITTTRTGTVKFGDYTQEWKPSWNIQPSAKFTFNPITALAAVLVIFCLIGFFTIIRGIAGVIIETNAIKQEALAIITGDFMPTEKKRKIIKIEKKGRGLSFRLASFTITLVLLIVIMISIPMYVIMTNRQRETLLESLQARSSVLLEGIASGVRTNMPLAIQSRGERGVLEMMYLPSQSSAIAEANYLTIMGYGIGSINTDHIWASNDPNIELKIDTTELRPGVSRFYDSEAGITFTEILETYSSELNTVAQERAREISQSIRDMTQEAQTIPMTDAYMERLMFIQDTINSLEVKLTEILAEVSQGTGSYPEFSTNKIDSGKGNKYIFFKPVMYRQGADNNFFRGFVILEVSLDKIIKEIFDSQMMLLLTIGLVALAALGIGVVGAFTLSILIVRPIKKLARHIEIIRDTEDKSQLAGVDIHISSKDEIAVLGNTI
ncbi:MAG: glycoside hydrolase, partial [Treponema sp.]|nr:glycoside hydrolase [Treponema sp.]